MDNTNKSTSTNKDQGSRESFSRTSAASTDLLKNFEPLKERSQKFVHSSETMIRQNLWISIFGATAIGAILGLWLRGSK